MTSEVIEQAMVERSKARLNRTVAALMQRGLDLQVARKLHGDGYTLGRLKQLGSLELKKIGVRVNRVASIDRVCSHRHATSELLVGRVLFASAQPPCD